MSNPSRHAEYEELLGALALNALDDDERLVVLEHVETCSTCRDELDTLRDTASLLGSSPQLAPDELWERISAGIGSPPPPMQLEYVSRRKKMRRWNIASTAAAAAVAALLGVGGTIAIKSDDDRPSITDTENQLAANARTQPGAQTSQLVSTDGKRVAEAIVLPGGQGFIVNQGLASLPQGLTYQLWAVTDNGNAISAGVLGNDPSIATFTADPKVKAIALTQEASGGVIRSTNPPVATGGLSA